MKTVPALRGASQIVDLALDLLSKETPAGKSKSNLKRSIALYCWRLVPCGVLY